MLPPREPKPAGPDPAERPGPSSAAELRAVVRRAADSLRGTVEWAMCAELALGLLTVKYLSDLFEERRARLERQLVERHTHRDRLDEILETRESYTAAGVCWVAEGARWSWIAAHGHRLGVGDFIDDIMESLMWENGALAGVLPTGFGRPSLAHGQLGELIEIVGEARFGSTQGRSAQDALIEVYTVLHDDSHLPPGLSARGCAMSHSVVRLITEILEPYGGRLYDPACGTGATFVEAARFRAAHRLETGHADAPGYGQEADAWAWRLARMNLLAKRLDVDLTSDWGDPLTHDRHPDLRADFVVTNPPFGMPYWGIDENDPRWRYGVPPAGSAAFAWLQHVVSKLSDRGTAGVVLADGAQSSRSPAERKIRQGLIEADLVAAIVTLPRRLFHDGKVSASIWLLAKDKRPQEPGHGEDRRGQILFVDARFMGAEHGLDQPELGDHAIALIAAAYRAWRGTPSARASGLTYTDEAGFSYSADIATVRRHGYVLTPGRYVNSPTTVADPATEEDVTTLTKDLYGLFP
ncbi:N-6 DNA methylase [Streptomyces sp. 12297]